MHMKTSDAVTHMIERAGKSKSEVSVEIGKHRNFVVSSQGRENWSPQVDTLVSIARACGYALVLEGNGERISLD